MSFFSEERKGDIIARMSGDVGEVENSITSSLDMLMKSPILILLYFITLVITSWQLTLFTIVVLPGMGWLMGAVGRKLKRQSLEAQSKWSDTMSQLEETLGGLRIIKAFIAEDKMINRFTKCSNELRDASNKVAIRQALAHPMSEFLGTILIVAVLWFVRLNINKCTDQFCCEPRIMIGISQRQPIKRTYKIIIRTFGRSNGTVQISLLTCYFV